MKLTHDLEQIVDAILCADYEKIQQLVDVIPEIDPHYKYFCALRLFRRHPRSDADEDKKAQRSLSAALATPPPESGAVFCASVCRSEVRH